MAQDTQPDERRVVIVTGSASGIGQATAIRFAAQSDRVILVDVANMDQTLSTIEERNGQAEAILTDVSRASDVERLVQQVIDAYGRIDVLVNNAAILISKSVADTSPEEWERVIGINLTGSFLCAHFVLPYMLKQERGAIINMASPHAFQTGRTIAAYAASKGGIVALTRQMALDYGRQGIRVNCVVPGAIDTPMLRADIQQGGSWEENLRGWERNQPVGRLGTPEDIAKVIVWLASEDAAFVLGAPIIADGGLLAQLLP